MGETIDDRVGLLCELANLPEPPESVPINMLVKVPGTPLENQEGVDPLDFVRTIAVARMMMPNSHVRLSAGREQMSEELQAMCFFAGANSIFYGEKLLTTDNPDADQDRRLFDKLGINTQAQVEQTEVPFEVCRSKLKQATNDASHSLYYDAMAE